MPVFKLKMRRTNWVIISNTSKCGLIKLCYYYLEVYIDRNHPNNLAVGMLYEEFKTELFRNTTFCCRTMTSVDCIKKNNLVNKCLKVAQTVAKLHNFIINRRTK